MSRRSKKKFDFAKDVYYFNIKKGYNNEITIKRMELSAAIHTYTNYLKTYKEACEWLGKWDGKKFIENNYLELLKAS